MSNLHTIGQAMVMYTAEYQGWLPGSGWTTGAMFWDFSQTPPVPATATPRYTIAYSPGLNESNDWAGPLARQMGIKDPAINGDDDRVRYRRYRELNWLTCPVYQTMPIAASSGSSADVGPGQGLSYCTSLAFLDKAWETFSKTDEPRLDGNLVIPADPTGTRGIITLPANYGPRITKIGSPSTKVFAADGARTIKPKAVGGRNVEQPPEYVISASPGSTNWDDTSYADYGAFGGWSHSAYRTAVPGNSANMPAQDLRIWAYRHGTLSAFKAAGTYRMNMVFFDGHVETLDDVQAANPALWMPTGSVICPDMGAAGTAVAGTKTVWSDVQKRYCAGVEGSSGKWMSP